MTTAAARTADLAPALSRLYFVRFGFALAWAGAMLTISSRLTPVVAVLLVLYPLFDVGAAVIDARASRRDGTPIGLYVNIALSTLTAIGVAVAVTVGVPSVLRVWGVWAVTAGAVQLAVGISRRGMTGHWPMIASGSISVFAGVSFFLGASSADPSLKDLGMYALLGGLFFLVSALRLRRAQDRVS